MCCWHGVRLIEVVVRNRQNHFQYSFPGLLELDEKDTGYNVIAYYLQ